MESVKIDGIEYVVLKSYTPEDLDEKKLRYAQVMRDRGIARGMTLKRPNGYIHYHAVEYVPANPPYENTRRFSKVVSLS